MLRDRRVLARLLTTGLLAMIIGGLLLSSQWHRTIKPSPRQVTTAPPGMMRLVRDEHDLVADMVRTQLAILDSGIDSKPIAAAERRLVIALR
jgi:hypothetical protein